MAENALRWPMIVGTYLEVEGCLGVALVGLLGGDMDFKMMDGFVMTCDALCESNAVSVICLFL